MATESTLRRVLLGIEPMFLEELYLASCDNLLCGRDAMSIDDPASGINWMISIVDGAITPSCSPEISQRHAAAALTSYFVKYTDASLTRVYSFVLDQQCIHVSVMEHSNCKMEWAGVNGCRWFATPLLRI
jgi:hypothetical protein